MISIIVSSYQKHYFEAFSKNVSETIGVPYEIIDIWNPGKMGICEAYNLGASKAQYENLVFCHEDILFHTENWGTILIDQLTNTNQGVIGLTGSNYVPKSPSGWYIPGYKPLENNVNISVKENAIVLDGMFLALRHEIYKKFPFSTHLQGFHGYDVDLCLQVAQQFQNIQLNSIKIDHFSSGKIDRQYLEAIIKVRNQRGYNYNTKQNDLYEYNSHIAFVKSFFKYHPVTLKNTINTLQYLPNYKSISFFFKTFKVYLSFWKHRNLINLKT